jgi:hypothetical protein
VCCPYLRRTYRRSRQTSNRPKLLNILVPQEGLEPPTPSLRMLDQAVGLCGSGDPMADIGPTRHPRKAIEPRSIDSHKLLETFEFREPYGSSGVQRSGEKRAYRRKTGQLYRFEGRSSDQKSLFLLGSIASQSTQRILGCGEAGGESGIRTHGTDFTPRAAFCLKTIRSPI